MCYCNSKFSKMKNTLIILSLIFACSLNAQDLNSLSKSASNISNSLDKKSFIGNFAADQVKKLAKKFNLTDQQQTQVSDLVVNQLKSEKFQKLISSFSPAQLMRKKTQSKIADSLMEDQEFKSGLDELLTEKQKNIE